MPPSKVRGTRVDCASNHSYLESRSRSSWTASAILKCRLCIGFSHLRWWIRQSRGRHQKKVITFSLLSSFPQKMAWYRYLKAKENPFEPTKTSKHRSQHVHWFHCKYNAMVFKFWLVIIATIIVNDGLVIDICVYLNVNILPTTPVEYLLIQMHHKSSDTWLERFH